MMLAMLIGALVFGLVISAFYHGVCQLAFRAGLIVSLRNIYLRIIKKRKTPFGNLLQIGIIVAVMSAILYATYLVTLYFGKSVIMISSLLVSGLAVYILTDVIFKRFGLSKITASLLGIFIAIGVVYLWFNFTSWIVSGFISLALATIFLIAFKEISVVQSLLIGAAIVVYDVVAVFGTGHMIKLANKLVGGIIADIPLPPSNNSLPILFTIPSEFTINPPTLFMMGLGDVIVPGLIVVAAFKAGRILNCRLLAWGASVGYIAGMLFSTLVLHIAKFPQPATIYLVPGVALGFLLAAAYCGKIKEVFVEEKSPD